MVNAGVGILSGQSAGVMVSHCDENAGVANTITRHEGKHLLNNENLLQVYVEGDIKEAQLDGKAGQAL